jgi:tRNA (adenine37-N6)-methyltransferase
MDVIELVPVATVVGGRHDPIDDDWGGVEAALEFDASRFEPEALLGFDDFSHLDVVYWFHRVDPDRITMGARHPRGRADWPKVGIFAPRGKARPNRLGVSTCELVGVDGLRVRVRGLDAIHGTPVLDVKPYLEEFGPRTPVREPAWARELMAGYW